MPKLVDTHAHVNFNNFKNDGKKVIDRALKHGIWIINVGAQYSTSKRAVEYAKKYKEGVYAVVGLHPSHVFDEELNERKYMELLENEKVVAVGEIGLEYGEDITDDKKKKQKEILFRQLEVAQHANKPIVFHCRKAYDDLIELLDMFNLGCASCPHA
ncbi:MAG: TatD family hydrolase, partial [Candidatus Portnoybacteria bacterium]